jgi:NAD(P)-dependent dehydrogenase (short-subunit alcohol dehydrogenase family)
MFSIAGKHALITGGGTGIGFGIAKLFAESGAMVTITGRRRETLELSASKISGKVYCRQNDITDVENHETFIEKIDQARPIDILVNNAGINLKKPMREVSNDELRQIIDTNLNGLFIISREVAKKMAIRKHGNILNITSMTSIYGIPGVTAYSASKSALLGLTRTMAVELAEHGIRVNAIAPGFIDTPMLQKAFDSDAERGSKVIERTPMKTLGSHEDVAYTALFLVSDEAKFITGVNLPVDGGNSIGF